MRFKETPYPVGLVRIPRPENNKCLTHQCGSVGKYAIDCADGRVCLNLMAKKSRFKGLLMPLKESYVEVGGNGAMAYRPTGGKRT